MQFDTFCIIDDLRLEDVNSVRQFEASAWHQLGTASREITCPTRWKACKAFAHQEFRAKAFLMHQELLAT